MSDFALVTGRDTCDMSDFSVNSLSFRQLLNVVFAWRGIYVLVSGTFALSGGEVLLDAWNARHKRMGLCLRNGC